MHHLGTQLPKSRFARKSLNLFGIGPQRAPLARDEAGVQRRGASAFLNVGSASAAIRKGAKRFEVVSQGHLTRSAGESRI